MEDSEDDRWELLNSTSISALCCIEIMETTFHLSSDPLFSCIITLYILILLYFPPIFFTIAFSPVVLLTGVLLLTLLRIGARQKLQIGNREDGDDKSIEAEKPDKSTQVHEWVVCPTKHVVDFSPNPDLEETFVEWNVRAPLEVIYEAYEGEEGDDPNDQKGEDQNNPTRFAGIERTSSLSMYYPESDSDNSSEGDFSETAEWDSPEKICFSWEEEDRESLIEIALEDHNKRGLGFHVEEENMIEIDISPGRNDDMFAEGD
ncbi:hypothetical protein HS088_TW09G00279 [Tripterygium wilfordii]|uniref:Transmembrane protein n=1 Tax=Tripterygium wilfordii TaxID=458696 RepID=A0A7J7D784_TRIWF|nr:uncharacterized protein LOC120005327 [Tripterygium wilfordii]XP_038710839.1 uncharacterized protein LOC120005327 [Tripterygium wilfordii]KAF5742235.1 hypothetical protein HS088_TW09G00279 [Tripterygium wilfordii]